jgi:hypothetical protein
VGHWWYCRSSFGDIFNVMTRSQRFSLWWADVTFADKACIIASHEIGKGNRDYPLWVKMRLRISALYFLISNPKVFYYRHKIRKLEEQLEFNKEAN